MKRCLKKNLMKKPAAARKKKKRPACMKVRKVMKKKQELLKRPSRYKKAWREHALKKADRDEIARWKVQKKQENVRARARRAARSGKPYQTQVPGLGDVAAAAHAAQAKSMKRADSAHEAAGSAHEAADEAKKDAADARVMAFLNSKRITDLEETVAETAAQAKRNEERLNVDDRQRGYVTPEQRD